jgi:glycosyltransferase involved in cell wall biosynthesis
VLQVEDSFGLAGFVARRCPLPVVTRLHGPWFLVGKALGVREDGIFRRRVADERRALSHAAGVTAPSHDVLARVRSCYGLALSNAAVIPNPVARVDATRRWRADTCERGRILFVGRFDRAKGADLILAAFAQLLLTHPDLHLTFVGPDSGFFDRDGRRWHSRDFIERIVPRPSDHQRIEYLGLQTPAQITALRRKAQMTVVCSRYETFGNVAAEAMAAGCPLIATAVGGLREIVQDGRNGLVCQPDDPEDLACKMVLLLRNPELGARLGKQATHDAEERYAPEVIARQMLDYYRAVLARVRTRLCDTAPAEASA